MEKNAMPIITPSTTSDLANAGQLMQKLQSSKWRSSVQGLANRRAEEAKLLQQWGGQDTQMNTTTAPKDIAVYNSKVLGGCLGQANKESWNISIV